MNSSRERDQSVERWLRQSHGASSAEVTGSCLDAETLAAMIDGGWSGPSHDAAQSHLADCARCQSLVAALARIEAATPPAAPRRVLPGWLAWAAPLTAAAAALAIWVAVPSRPSAPPLPYTTVGRLQEAAPRVQPPSSPQARGDAAEKALTVERPQPTVAHAARRDSSPAEPSLPPRETSTADRLAKSSALPDARPAFAPRAADQAPPASGPASAAARAPVPPSTPPASASAPASAAAESVAIAPPAAVGSPVAAARALAAVRPPSSPAQGGAIEIVSPDASVRWRIAGPTVQRSIDGGAAWDTQATGNAVALTAGAAPSPSVCWVVGRGGVVLLSTDGRTWRRLPFPETTDLSAVRARDARSASISTADGRPFSTTDAGATWLPRPLQDF